jgi:hypothetical protein
MADNKLFWLDAALSWYVHKGPSHQNAVLFQTIASSAMQNRVILETLLGVYTNERLTDRSIPL